MMPNIVSYILFTVGTSTMSIVFCFSLLLFFLCDKLDEIINLVEFGSKNFETHYTSNVN